MTRANRNGFKILVVLIAMTALGAVFAAKRRAGEPQQIYSKRLDKGTRPETREEKNKLLVKVAIGALNAGDWENLKEMYSPRYVQHDTRDKEIITRSEWDVIRSAVRKTFPSFKYEIEDIIAEGDKVAVRLRWSAREKRWFSKPGNREGDITGTEIDLIRIEDGRIAEEWCEYDPKQIMKLISAMKYMGKS